MATIGTLNVEMAANVARLSRDLEKAQRSMGNFKRNAAKIAKTAGAAIAGGLATAGLVKFTQHAIDAADAIAKSASKANIATGTYQELVFALDKFDVSQSEVNSGLQAFTKRLGEARAGTGALVTFLNKYDKSLLNSLQGAKDNEQALNLMTKALGEVKNDTDRAALSAAAFGRTAGIGFANALKNGVDSLDDWRRRARELGIVLDEQLLRNAENAKDQMAALSTVIRTQAIQAVVNFAPQIQKLVEGLIEVTQRTKEFGQAIGVFTETPQEKLQELLETIRQVSNDIENMEQTGVGGIGSLERAKEQLEKLRNQYRELIKANKEAFRPQQTTSTNDSIVEQIRLQQEKEKAEAEAAKKQREREQAEQEAINQKIAMYRNVQSLAVELGDQEDRLFAAAVNRSQMVIEANENRVISEQRMKELLLQIEQDYQLQKEAIQLEAQQKEQERREQETAALLATWEARAQTYIGFAQQMATMGVQFALAEGEARENIGKRVLGTAIRFLSQQLAAYLFNKSQEKLAAAASAAAQIAASASVASTDLTIGGTRAAWWASYYAAHAANPVGAAIYSASAAAMAAVAGSAPAAAASAAAVGASGVGANLLAAAGYAAAGIAVTALGEGLASQVEGTNSGDQSGVYGAGSNTSPVITQSEQNQVAQPKQTNQVVNIYVNGNIVDHDKFAREVYPSLRKAINDGVR